MDIRAERPEDIPEITRVNDLAFGRPHEGRLVQALRSAAALTLSLVAIDAGDLVGHVAFSTVELVGDTSAAALGLGPLAVLPSQQRRGVGSRLVNAALARLRREGEHALVFVLGAPAYYARFGFVPAARHGLRWEHDAPDAAFQVLELSPGALADRHGVVRYHPAFDDA